MAEQQTLMHASVSVSCGARESGRSPMTAIDSVQRFSH